MPKQPYLTSTKRGYIYRRRVPDDLREHVGKREIKTPLKAKDYREACELARLKATEDDALFFNLRKKHTEQASEALSDQELRYM